MLHAVILMVWVTIVAKNALDEALAENEIIEDAGCEEQEPCISYDQRHDLEKCLISKTESSQDNGEG